MKLISVSKVEYIYTRKICPHLIIHAKWGLRNLRIILKFEKNNIWRIYNDWKKHEYDMIKRTRINADPLLRRLYLNDFNYLVYPRQTGKSYEYYRLYWEDEIYDFYKRFVSPVAEFEKVNKNMSVLSEYVKKKFLEELNFQREILGEWKV